MGKKVLLMILDGWGLGPHNRTNAIYFTASPYWDFLNHRYATSKLMACGEDVGLPDGQMGNSEVGHLNIGAGRVVYQDLVKINRAIADGSITQNPEIEAAYSRAKQTGCNLHIMGLTSNGGVHSSLEHLKALINIADQYGLSNVFVHCFMDGRDTDPHSGHGFVTDIENHCKAHTGAVATVIGRYYAMDRDKNFDRIAIAYNALVRGEGNRVDSVTEGIKASYDEGVTDEFIRPIVNSNVDGRIKDGDVVIFFNFRNDRAKEITIALTQSDFPEHNMAVVPNLHYCCMTPYDPTFNNMHILFPKEDVTGTLAEYISSLGLKQLHIAETEKYAHVTFFLNGGREKPFDGEDRILVPSPKVATYDLQPEMSAPEVCAKLVDALCKQTYDFVVVNYANGDMVGHTGVYPAIQGAVETIDQCLENTVEAARLSGYEVLIIADHGNADCAIQPNGEPDTAHSLNPVPCIYVTDDKRYRLRDGRLADVAPTVLHIMGLPQPENMTGHNLIIDPA